MEKQKTGRVHADRWVHNRVVQMASAEPRRCDVRRATRRWFVVHSIRPTQAHAQPRHKRNCSTAVWVAQREDVSRGLRKSESYRERFKQGGWCWRWPTLAWARPRLPSALVGLTAGFGMGPGVPPPLLSPTSTPHCRVVERSPGRLGCASLALPACLHPCGRVLARSELNRMSSREGSRPLSLAITRACVSFPCSQPHLSHSCFTQSTMILGSLSPRALVRLR